MKGLFKGKFSLKKTVILCVIAACIVFGAVFGGITLSKYIRSFGKDEHSLNAGSFYFSSDILEEEGTGPVPSVPVYDWDFENAFSVNLYNYIFGNENLFSVSTVRAKITVSAIEGTAALQNSADENIAIVGGSAAKKTVPIVVTPLNNKAVFKITAVSSPYTKTLSAEVTLNGSPEGGDCSVRIDETGTTSNDAVCYMVVTTTPSNRYDTVIFTFAWNKNILVPDMTNEYLMNAEPLSNGGQNNMYKMTLKTGGSYRIAMFKTDTTKNYAKELVPQTGDQSGVTWSYEMGATN